MSRDLDGVGSDAEFLGFWDKHTCNCKTSPKLLLHSTSRSTMIQSSPTLIHVTIRTSDRITDRLLTNKEEVVVFRLPLEDLVAVLRSLNARQSLASL